MINGGDFTKVASQDEANSLGLFTKSSDVTATKISEWNNYEKPQLQTKLIAYIDN